MYLFFEAQFHHRKPEYGDPIKGFEGDWRYVHVHQYCVPSTPYALFSYNLREHLNSCWICKILVIDNNSNHIVNSIISYFDYKSILIKKSKIHLKVIFGEDFLFKHILLWCPMNVRRIHTKTSLQEHTLAFTSNKENMYCSVRLMYLLPGSFVIIQEIIWCFLH